MGAVRVPVVRHRQNGHFVYMGYLSAELAGLVTFADHYPPGPGRRGYQRPPDPRRAQAFAQYLKNDPAGFMTPVLLNARNPISFQEFPGQLDVGYLSLEPSSALAIVDGQHRSLGVQEFLGAGDQPVPFMLFDQLDIETEQELFITINREQKRVSMSHVRFVDRDGDPMAEMVARLESDLRSAWYRKVNLVGAKGTKRPVSLQSLRTAMEALLQAGEIRALAAEDQYLIARDFWSVVASIWPDAWGAPRSSLLTKSLGTLAVAKMGGYLLPRCLKWQGPRVTLDEALISQYLRRAQSVDWMSNGTFQGYSGRHGADLVKNRLDALIFSRVIDEVAST